MKAWTTTFSTKKGDIICFNLQLENWVKFSYYDPAPVEFVSPVGCVAEINRHASDIQWMWPQLPFAFEVLTAVETIILV